MRNEWEVQQKNSQACFLSIALNYFLIQSSLLFLFGYNELLIFIELVINPQQANSSC